MEQKGDDSNVFSVNVGNLPPGKEVDVMITYVTELQFEEGQLKFTIPSSNNNLSSQLAATNSSMPPLQLRVNFSTCLPTC